MLHFKFAKLSNFNQYFTPDLDKNYRFRQSIPYYRILSDLFTVPVQLAKNIIEDR